MALMTDTTNGYLEIQMALSLDPEEFVELPPLDWGQVVHLLHEISKLLGIVFRGHPQLQLLFPGLVSAHYLVAGLPQPL